MSRIPLLIGDTVEVISGPSQGRTGVYCGYFKENEAHVFFAEIREETPDGGLRVGSDTGDFNWNQLAFRGQPLDANSLSPLTAKSPADSDLLGSVLQRPHDNDERLVYADWLEERGDPHAEYLRVQVALSQAVTTGEESASLLDRERRLRATLHPGWISQVRRLTSEPLPFDISAIDPELAAKAAPAIRLHPRLGATRLHESKLGGMPLWPADEPWPTIVWSGNTTNYSFLSGDAAPESGEAIPLVFVLQLRQREFPLLPFPEGTDLMQLFWLPIWGEEAGPEPKIFWRREGSIDSPLTQAPPCKHAQWGLQPTECRLYPETITEYPDHEDHQPNDAVWSAVDAWSKSFNKVSQGYRYFWSHCHGSKVGGYDWVNQSDCERVYRETEDGRPMNLLLTLSSDEINHCHWRWCAMEDRHLCFANSRGQDAEATGGFYQFSRGNYNILVDPKDPRVIKPYYVYSS